MSGVGGGMELWAIVPELILAGLVLALLPVGSFLPAARQGIATWVALIGLGAAAVASARMWPWPSQAVFQETYAVDPFAVYFKWLAIAATAFVLLATYSHFRDRPHAGVVPALLPSPAWASLDWRPARTWRSSRCSSSW